MSQPWRRKRDPSDVPTPTAVAASDFCRRAQAPASAQQVRDALSALSEDEDFRVRAIADAEPGAAPLGPYALVDMVLGASAELAAKRQACGYYDVVTELLALHDAPPAPAGSFPPSSPTVGATEATAQLQAYLSPASGAEGAGGKKGRERVEDRIAPVRRPARGADPAEAPAGEAPPPSTGRTGRPLPAPRGRFTKVDATKSPTSDLLAPDSAELLDNLLLRHGHRVGVLQSLRGQFAGRAGTVLTMSDVDAALKAHGLFDRAVRAERDLLLTSFAEHRGAEGRVCWALKLSPVELGQLVESAGVKQDVEEVRERFRREALSPVHLQQRLDLLFKERYLRDLGITRRFTDSLAGELRQLLGRCAAEAQDEQSLVELTARKFGLNKTLLARAIDRLRLTEDVKKLASVRASHHAS